MSKYILRSPFPKLLSWTIDLENFSCCSFFALSSAALFAAFIVITIPTNTPMPGIKAIGLPEGSDWYEKIAIPANTMVRKIEPPTPQLSCLFIIIRFYSVYFIDSTNTIRGII